VEFKLENCSKEFGGGSGIMIGVGEVGGGGGGGGWPRPPLVICYDVHRRVQVKV